ncbi:MAG: hypothetical protein ACI4QT_01505 [Kiritimatiellia bacterium]
MRSTNKSESYNAAIRDGGEDLRRGYGEIIDMGEMSRSELGAGLIEGEVAIRARIREIRSAEEETKDWFVAPLVERTDAEIRAEIEAANDKIRARMATAPDAHIYDYRYCV